MAENKKQANKDFYIKALVTKICTDRTLPDMKYELAFFEEHLPLIKKIIDRKNDLPSVELLQRNYAFKPEPTDLTLTDILENLNRLYFQENSVQIIREFGTNAGNPENNIEDLLDIVTDKLSIIKSHISRTTHVSLDNDDDIESIVNDYIESGKVENLFMTGFNKLDEIVKLRMGQLSILFGATGSFKCFGKDTPVLMYDGTIKMVQDVKVDEMLMGPDSTPRKVLSLASGQDELFKIIPTKGDTWVCNSKHILTLKHTKTKKIIDIPLDEYLEKNKTFKHCHKQFSVGVDFDEQQVDIEPYYAGLWIGDGTKTGATITTGDQEIKDYIEDLSVKYNLDFKVRQEVGNCEGIKLVRKNGRGPNALSSELRRDFVVNNEKRIPQKYLANSRKKRLELLAGIVDSDGCCPNETMYVITTKYEGLKDDYLYLARSLGFHANARQVRYGIKSTGFSAIYWTVHIYGAIEQVPALLKRKTARKNLQKKDPLSTGIRVEAIGKGDFYGFEIEGDGRFLKGDFTVVHNTSTTVKILVEAMKAQLPIVYFSLELHPHEMINRLLAARGTFKFNDLYNVQVSRKDYANAVKDLKHNFTLITRKDNPRKIDVKTIERYIAEKRPKIVFIDHGLLLDCGLAWDSEDRLTQNLKRISLVYGCHILLLWQGNAETNKEPKMPTLADLANNRGISRDADVVIGMYAKHSEFESTVKIFFETLKTRNSARVKFSYIVDPNAGIWDELEAEIL